MVRGLEDMNVREPHLATAGATHVRCASGRSRLALMVCSRMGSHAVAQYSATSSISLPRISMPTCVTRSLVDTRSTTPHSHIARGSTPV